MKTKLKTGLLVFLIVAAGLTLRVVNIENTPPGVYPDEAVNGVDALNAIDSGNWQWFYEANNGREGLFMNLIALCFKFFGVSVLALRLPSIIFGTLTILGTYLLAKEFFGRRVGIMSGFLVATAFWAINFSRISFRANMLPAVLAFSFYFLWKGLNYRKNHLPLKKRTSRGNFKFNLSLAFSPAPRTPLTSRWKEFIYFALGGLIFGIGLHTYIAFRIAPAILAVMLIIFFISRKNFFKDYWKSILIFVLFAALTAAPMLYTFFVAHPEYFSSRTGNVSVLNPEVNQGHLVKTFLKSFGLSLAKYNIWGDQNWRHNYPPYAILDPITGVAFTFGFAYAVIRFLHLFYLRFRRNEWHPRFEIYAFLLSWFFIMLAPEFMTAEGNPHALRSIGTLPVVFIFAALTFEFFIWKSYHHGKFFQKFTLFLITVTLLIIGTFNVIKYHFFWARQEKTAESFDQNIMDVSRYISTLPAAEEKFVIAESMQRIPIQIFHWSDPRVSYVYPSEAAGIAPDGNNFEIIFTDRNDEAIASAQDKFPNMSLEEKKDKFGLSIFVLK